jgi:thymidylate kinase
MDGSGKSSSTEAIVERLRESGIPVKRNWHRLGQTEALWRIGHATPRLWRPREADGRLMTERRGPLRWLWTLVVVLVTLRSYMLSAGLTRRGIGVVCDRWVADSLVDLRLAYGRHRVGEWLLRAVAPRPDVDLVLVIDAATAAARKPDDQPRAVLDAMEQVFDWAIDHAASKRIDATRPQADVLADVLAEVDAAIAGRR